MEKQIKTFEFDSQEVRVLNIDGNPWFVGKDVAKILGYKKPRNALATHVDSEDKILSLIQSNDSNYKAKTTLINESGLYSLIFKSKLPNAKRVREWIEQEVLPSLRKTDNYTVCEEYGLILKAMLILQKRIKDHETKIQEQTKQIEQDRSKVFFANVVETSYPSILIGELAKILNQSGVDTDQHRLFDWLRKNGYLGNQSGSSYNMPTQKSIDLDLFKVKERTNVQSNGSIEVTRTSMVTGKGQIYFINKFLAI